MVKFNKVTKVWEGANFPYVFPSDTFMGEKILEKLKETPNRVVQINHDTNHELTCDELRFSSIRVAQNSTKLGIKADDVVGIICRHSEQLSILLTGCILIGAPVNPLDLSFNVNDIKHLFGQTLPKMIVCDLEMLERVKEALKELNSDARVIVIDHEGVADTFSELLTPTGTENDFVAPKFEQNAEDKILAILCSSGTTGSPKGVQLSHARFLSYLIRKQADKPSLNLTFSPFFWGSAFFPYLYLAFAQTDVRVSTREAFSIEKLSEIVRKRAITHLTLPPMNLHLTLQSEFPNMIDHSSIIKIISIGSTATANLRKQFEEIFPEKDMLIAYGTTEISVSVTLSEEYKAPFCVGSMIFPGVSLKIIDDDHQKLGVCEVGEICVSPHVKFLGYNNNPVASKNALDDEGFFKTGDVGYIDEKGCLFVVDRKKEVMKCKGYQIHTSEIENVIEAIEGVEAVSVVGIPDEIASNLPAAVIVKRKGFEHLTEQSVKDFVAEKLPFYKHLEAGVYFVDELPVTPSGKVRKNIVTDIVKQRRSIF